MQTPMTAKTVCNACGQHIEFPEELAGKSIPCPNCGEKTSLWIPNAATIRIPKQPDKTAAGRVRGNSYVAPVARRIVENIEKVIVDKHDTLMLTLMAYFAGGHVLLEDVPGVAKTMLANALARRIGCSFKRIQCTTDLLPKD